jgi:hypothetical protein
MLCENYPEIYVRQDRIWIFEVVPFDKRREQEKAVNG